MIKNIVFNCLVLVLLINSSLLAQNYRLNSTSLVLQVDSVTGGIQSITNNQDQYHMNWILKSDSTQYPWQTRKLAWGLGFGIVSGDTVRWNTPFSRQVNNNHFTFRYKTKYFELDVERKLSSDGVFTESYRFINTSTEPVLITDLGIYTPFNDNYPDSKTCIEARCDVHIWAGNNDSYVFAERMGGEPPHLGLVLTNGSLQTYEILNRSRNIYPWTLSGSNVRGTIVLNSADISLQPKQNTILKWVIFSAKDWNDFYTKAESYGFVKATAKNYIIEKEQPLQAVFESQQLLKNVQCYLNDSIVPFKQTGGIVEINVLPITTGDLKLKMIYNDNRSTFIKACRIENIDSLIKKRTLFIVSKQQLNDTSDERYGAYMVYDNETNSIYKNDDVRKSSDTNEGRERVGMGVFLAMYLQTHPDSSIKASLDRYYNFVRYKLQRPDYSVKSDIDGKVRRRVYNYPWVAQLYLEIYKLTHYKKYLFDYYHTVRKYFIDSNHSFYAIGVPVQDGLAELKKAGMNFEYDTLIFDCCQTADKFVQTSLYFPKHEVNFEQSIVAPSIVFLLEMYQVTSEEKYFKEAEKQLKALETFSGFQPDYHLNEIGIRHWDGYWFGKRQFWGDVMPHYWSTITSEAYARYAAITGKKEYYKRAQTIVQNNLCQFFNDGSASCAYIYPSKVNGQKAAFFDPFANDQDWALVYYLKYLRLRQQ
jgi:hypothetical protein